MNFVKKMLLGMVMSLAACANFPYHPYTFTGTTALPSEKYQDFAWSWYDHGTPQITATFPYLLTNIVLRLANQQNGKAYLTIYGGSISYTGSTTTIQMTLSNSNIPPNQTYYADFLTATITTNGTNVVYDPSRILGRGKITTFWDSYSASNAAAWTQEQNNAYVLNEVDPVALAALAIASNYFASIIISSGISQGVFTAVSSSSNYIGAVSTQYGAKIYWNYCVTNGGSGGGSASNIVGGGSSSRLTITNNYIFNFDASGFATGGQWNAQIAGASNLASVAIANVQGASNDAATALGAAMGVGSSLTNNYVRNDSAANLLSLTVSNNIASATDQDLVLRAGGSTGDIVLKDSAGMEQVRIHPSLGVKIGAQYYLESSFGMNGQVLTTDGAGATHWLTPAAGASFGITSTNAYRGDWGDSVSNKLANYLPLTGGTLNNGGSAYITFDASNLRTSYSNSFIGISSYVEMDGTSGDLNFHDGLAGTLSLSQLRNATNALALGGVLASNFAVRQIVGGNVTTNNGIYTIPAASAAASVIVTNWIDAAMGWGQNSYHFSSQLEGAIANSNALSRWDATIRLSTTGSTQITVLTNAVGSLQTRYVYATVHAPAGKTNLVTVRPFNPAIGDTGWTQTVRLCSSVMDASLHQFIGTTNFTTISVTTNGIYSASVNSNAVDWFVEVSHYATNYVPLIPMEFDWQ